MQYTCDLCSQSETAEIREKLFVQRNTLTDRDAKSLSRMRESFLRERLRSASPPLFSRLLHPPPSRLPFARSCAIYEAKPVTLFASLDFAKNVDFCDIYRLGT